MIGVVLISIVGLVIYVKFHHHHHHPIDKILKPEDYTINATRSSCSNQFELGYRVKISICYPEGDPVVDIREFLANRPTIKGIQLSKEEWGGLMNYAASVDHIVRYGS